MKDEADFQSTLKKKIEKLLPGAEIFKTDPRQKRGIPDLLILYEDKWGALECKRSSDASRRLHQDYYVNKWNNMSFARFISPENEKEVLDELQNALRA